MRFVISNQGAVVVKYSPDEVAPLGGYMARHLIDLLRTTYQFSVSPEVPIGVAASALPAYHFQSGMIFDEEGLLPIKTLVITANIIMVISQDTSKAEKILGHILDFLDANFSYRFKDTEKEKIYQSNITVDFQESIDRHLGSAISIGRLIAEATNNSELPTIKRLHVGYGDLSTAQTPTNLPEGIDFLIERRTGEPLSKNRYFCSAPLATERHVQLMTDIEHALLDDGRDVN